MSQITRQLDSLYCDDVRTEESGKKIFIGVYGPAMVVNEFPAQLPNLSVVLSLVFSKGFGPKRSLSYRILIDDTIFAEAAMPPGDVAKSAADEETLEEGQVNRLVGQFNFTPITIAQPCVIRVRAVVDDEEVRALGLAVIEAPKSAVGSAMTTVG